MHPRLFHLQRDTDTTGASGTGRVADGVLWPDGTVTIRWRGDRASTVNWNNLADAEAVHGHGGMSRIVFDDETAAAEVARLTADLRALTGHNANALARHLADRTDELETLQAKHEDQRDLCAGHSIDLAAAQIKVEDLTAERDEARAQLADATDRAETAEAQLADMHRREEQRIAREFQRLGDRMQLASRRALRIADTAAALAAPVPLDPDPQPVSTEWLEGLHEIASREPAAPVPQDAPTEVTHAWDESVTWHADHIRVPLSHGAVLVLDQDSAIVLADMLRDAATQPAQDAAVSHADDPADASADTETTEAPNEPHTPPQDATCGHGPDWWAIGLGGITGCMVCGPQPPAEPTTSTPASEETPA